MTAGLEHGKGPQAKDCRHLLKQEEAENRLLPTPSEGVQPIAAVSQARPTSDLQHPEL